MLMARIARAFTGRDTLLKLDVSAHGFYEAFDLELREDGSVGSSHGGVPANAGLNVIVGRFNDCDDVRRSIEENADRLAAVIVSPVAASESGHGYCAADPAFLAMLRAATSSASVLLLFDEVVTFRLARGGAQDVYGIRPDLTALGKMIGGGLPIGAVGGRAEVMAVTSPTERRSLRGKDNRDPRRWLGVSGSFNGNPATMAAGLATLQLLTPAAYRRLDALGTQLRDGLHRVGSQARLPLSVSGLGSVWSLNIDPALCGDDRELTARLVNAVRIAFVTRGVLAFPHFIPSTVATPSDVEECLSVAGEILNDLATRICN